MTLLQVMAAADAADVRVRTTDNERIGTELAGHGITFGRWPVVENAASVSSEELLAHYAKHVAELNESGRYRHIDIARIHPDDGCFYLHLGEEVLAVVCEGGDLLSVPAGTLHWFDMGERPDFIAIRFFEEEDGWVGDFTGDKISAGFPTLDELLTAP